MALTSSDTHTAGVRVGRAGLGGRVPTSLKFLPGMGLGGGVQFLIFLLGGGGGSGQPGTPSGYTRVQYSEK